MSEQTDATALDRAVDARLVAFDPPTAPAFTHLQRRRTRRRRTRAAGVLVLVLAVGGTGTLVTGALRQTDGSDRVATTALPPLDPAEGISSPEGVRTDPDGQGLAASYTGGACDGPARLDVAESADAVTLRITVVREQDVCIAIGIGRTVEARLTSPLGDRPVLVTEQRDGPEGAFSQRRLVPFDGSRLLSPASLPPSYELRNEGGSRDRETDPSPTASWSRTYTTPERPPTASGACGPGPAPLQLDQGPAAGPGYGGPDWRQDGNVQIGAATATVLRGRNDFTGMPLGLALTWQGAGGTVTLASQVGCGGDTVLTLDELVTVARSLRPA